MELTPSVFFEHPTLRELGNYLVANHREALGNKFPRTQTPVTEEKAPEVQSLPETQVPSAAADTSGDVFGNCESSRPEPIAIIGMSGRFPEAEDTDAFWRNLLEGKDCIREIPKERWGDMGIEPDAAGPIGKNGVKWAGLMQGVDEFDALFFGISPHEAELMDPQHRLLMTYVWKAIEDAGYSPQSLSGSKTAILVGTINSGYSEVVNSLLRRESATAALPSMGPNRMSYLLNLHGPSEPIETACSSSLVAIHRGRELIASGACTMAIVGGINTLVSPEPHISYSKAGMLSEDGRSKTFSARADGYVRSEGAGILVLKGFRAAERDGDHIYGLLRGSAENHGGRSNSLTAPNPKAQAELIKEAYSTAGIDCKSVGYIEAHGTGTALGDPIEVDALKSAFQHLYQAAGETEVSQHCGLGSAKTNIGHLELAAGVAGVIKVLLQFRHKTLVKTLHCEELNPYIQLKGSPFYIVRENRAWRRLSDAEGRELPLRAGVSSFGFGGVNAHVVLEEYVPVASERCQPTANSGPSVVVLSARNEDRLRVQATHLRAAIVQQGLKDSDLESLAYTLQVGREGMEHRVAMAVASMTELAEKLQLFIDGQESIEDFYRGEVKRTKDALTVFKADEELQEAIGKWIQRGKFSKLLSLWVKGLEFDWNRLYEGTKPPRISLPGYPFAKERHWLERPAAATANAPAALHPLLHRNTSDLSEQRFSTTLQGNEFFLADHRIGARGDRAQRVLPAVAYLEMARAAIAQACEAPSQSAVLELENIAWSQPILVDQPRDVHIALAARNLSHDNPQIEFEVYTVVDGQEVTHCQGMGTWRSRALLVKLDPALLRQSMQPGRIDPTRVYDAFARMGVVYGPSLHTITDLYHQESRAFAELRLPRASRISPGEYLLHPSLMDGSLQACLALLDNSWEFTQRPRLPFALETLRVLSPCVPNMFAWVRSSPASEVQGRLHKLDIDLCDEQGNACVEMRGFSWRILQHLEAAVSAQERERVAMLLRPLWQMSGLSSASSVGEFARHDVVVCELPGVNAEKLGELVAANNCVQLCGQGSIAERYSSGALACLEQVQSIFRSKPAGKVLLQVVTPSEVEGAMLAGFSGLLRTAVLENPQLVAQTIMVPLQIAETELARLLQQEKASGLSPLVCYRGKERFTQGWEEAGAVVEAATLPYADDGIYLITGGLGGLGRLFAREILESTANARVVLTGRSASGEATAGRLAELGSWAARVSYRQLDLSDSDAIKALIYDLVSEGGKLRGILHGAGMIADNFLLKKSGEEFLQVLGPKVQGTYHLDLASAAVELDWFVMFASLSGVFGNVGQSDYAAGNGFMDQFALHREEQVKLGLRHGHTVSLDWGLWQAGGMQVAAEIAEVARRTTGMEAMATAAGLAAFARGLRLPQSQLLVAAGDGTRMRRALAAGLEAEAKPAVHPPATQEPAAHDLSEKTEDYLRRQLSALLKLPAHRIDPQAALEQYGIDSILAIKLTNQLEETFGPLSKTLFFEYQTIAELAKYFVAHQSSQLASIFTYDERGHAEASASAVETASRVPERLRFRRSSASPRKTAEADRIAIVGLSGRYPGGADIEAYWSNLREGKDCIVEVPRERWDWREYFSADRTASGHHFTKWGGFISGVDEFDPRFFNVSPADAELMDPQERLFLQHAWMAIEDAGYTRASLQTASAQDLPGQVGVYAGVWLNEYQLLGVAGEIRGKRVGIPGSIANIANRVSYVLDLHGPSMTLDTMCSSSLSAIDLACQDLKRERTSLAIAGGVNVSIHPNKYLLLSALQAISSEGHCQSFGEGGDGYIPGEGVGVVVLKRLSDAERDGDHIYGVIRGSALNHGGKTNGYTVPNPQAQASAISRALAESGVDARQISYIEAHGTGTRLGDPIEIAALSKAFAPYTDQREFCLIGSAKSNIGHCESAAGIAGLTKVLLQMQHGEIVPSLHSEVLNPHIDFSQSPFVVNQRLRSWERPVVEGRESRRIAGISSFGAGGSNAHLIVEEYPEPASMAKPNSVLAIVISARTAAQLQEKARELLRFVSERPVDLVRLAYTLQVGREGMEERVGLVVSTVAELEQKLTGYVNGATDLEEVYAGQVRKNKEGLWLFNTDADLQQTMEKWLEAGKLTRLLELWVQGVEIDWAKLYKEARPRRMSLPAYPFARERYWIEVAARQDATTSGPSHLHPLLHRNTSDLREQRYSSTFTGEEFFLSSESKFLPMAACLEMARAAVEQAWPGEGWVELREVVWLSPIEVNGQWQVHIALQEAAEGEQVEYEIYSQQGPDEVVYCRGQAVRTSQTLKPLAEAPEYVLHPAALAAALEACEKLLGEQPVALTRLDSVRIISPTTPQTTPRIRYAPGQSEQVVSLDLDLHDEHGNVSVELRGVCWQARSTEISDPAGQLVRKEIVFATDSQPVLLPKPSGIPLTALSEATAAFTQGIRVTPIKLVSPEQRTEQQGSSSVRLYDCGAGMFSIVVEPAGVTSAEALRDLGQALMRAEQDSSLKVLLLSGLDHCLRSREDANEAIRQGFYRALVRFAYPVIGIFQQDTTSAGFLAAALCDFMVLNEEATFGFIDPANGFVPGGEEAALVAERFGAARARQLLYAGTGWTGKQLSGQGWTCPMASAAQVEQDAEQLAQKLSSKPQLALRLLKQHLTRSLGGLVESLREVETIVLSCGLEQILILDLSRDVLDQLQQASSYQAVVLTGEFGSAVDDETLLTLSHALRELGIPVVAALAGDGRGETWLLGLCCDACIYSRDGIYTSSGLGESPRVGQLAAVLFADRLGNLGKEALLTAGAYSGRNLEQRAGAWAAEREQVLGLAREVAKFWAAVPRLAFTGWKKQSAAKLKEALRTPLLWSVERTPPLRPGPIALASKVIHATVHGDGIVVVKMEDREAKNMFSPAWGEGMTEAFAHIAETPGYKVVVLTGYDSYFCSGGTREGLLAIQSGKARFTDLTAVQAALDCKLPVIAAMQGHGIGAGWSVGMFADLVLLSDESQYVSPYMNYGFTPGGGATWILGDKMGWDLARESLFTGEPFTGLELKARGVELVVTPRSKVYDAAMELAAAVARHSRAYLVGLKEQWTRDIHPLLAETNRHELAMHEQTFVGQSSTLALIEKKFSPQVEAVPVSVQPRVRAQQDGLLAVVAGLRTLLAAELLLGEEDVTEDVQFVDLGLDSISGVSWVRKINEKYGTRIEAIQIYSYPTLGQLGRYVKQEAEKNGTVFSQPEPSVVPVAEITEPRSAPREKVAPLRGRRSIARSNSSVRKAHEPSHEPTAAIAVIGMAGQFPKARNLEEFWQNIAQGRNCISQVPSSRWEVDAFYQPGEPMAGKTNSRWMGALEDFDRFDPLFFNLSPWEAENMDPQQRLFLEACWHSIENAGYDARVLSGSKCGVFVGCATGDYDQLSSAQKLSAQGFTGNAMSILAARISYFLNLQGPCLSIDTACSSSLVAIAHACDSLLSGSSDVALAGGVCVMAGPALHIMASQAGMLSQTGQCFTFDGRADGTVLSEGVGVVMLKRLADAERDGDIIQGVLEGWGVNQDGKTNGITAPNAESQARLEQEIYSRFQIDPANLQLIEAHGTGTKLGDPIEVLGLKQAFQASTQKKEYCALGSVKSNIGHTATAAGVAGLLKLLLAIQHKQLPPTINFERLNEHIDLSGTPFYINQGLEEWKLNGTARRQAAVSSFGFSGTNAHVVVGEYLPPLATPQADAKTIVPLSARNSEQLKEKVRDLLNFLRRSSAPIHLTELAYTLQVGRTGMEERMGLVVSSVEELAQQLEAYLAGKLPASDFYQGQARAHLEEVVLFSIDADLQQTVRNWIDDRKLVPLLKLWVKGLDLDWNRFYPESRPRRICLPAYPFAKERYWVSREGIAQAASYQASSVLHPLLHRNISNLAAQRFRSTFTGNEFFLADHQVSVTPGGKQKMMPGVAYLEMARAAAEEASPARPDSSILELNNVVWAKPLVVTGTTEVSMDLTASEGLDQVDFEIYTGQGGQLFVHCQGQAVWSDSTASPWIDLPQLRKQMNRDELDAHSMYSALAGMGLFYGPAHQGIGAIYPGKNQLLALLRLPAVVQESRAAYGLHPSLLDGVLQATVGLRKLEDVGAAKLPFALESLRIESACTEEMWAWVRYCPDAQSDDRVVKLDIDVCDPSGKICVQMRGFSFREFANAAEGRMFFAVPEWQPDEIAAANSIDFSEHHVVLCGLPQIEGKVDSWLPSSHILSIHAGPETGVGQRYSHYAQACFGKIQELLLTSPQKKILLQIVAPGNGDHAISAGLSGLLRTATLENPQLTGQLVLVPENVSAEDVARQLQRERNGQLEVLVKYDQGARYVSRWQEIAVDHEAPPVRWREDGVYLITGGLGRLGVHFTREILSQTHSATVVLTGRSAINAEKQGLLNELQAGSGRVSYRQVDLGDLQQVSSLIADIETEGRRLRGILHAAGMIADNFIIKKPSAEFIQVLAPKVVGTENLDRATSDSELDFFALFSSLAAVTGNPGQADYAAGNAFMDHFAAYRNQLVSVKQRHGRTVSINWPLWREGGMAIDTSTLELVKENTGMEPMETSGGFAAFYRSLAISYSQVAVAQGNLSRIRRVLLAEPSLPISSQEPIVGRVDAANLVEKTQDYLRKQLSALLKMPANRIDPQAPLEQYGIDSILAMQLTNQLEKTFGQLSKTLFFEYQTIEALGKYFVDIHASSVTARFPGSDSNHGSAKVIHMQPRLNPQDRSDRNRRVMREPASSPARPVEAERIAIVGLSGRYPEAIDIEQYWSNLRDGRDCIVEVPRDRWDWRKYLSEDRAGSGRHFSKWGGFISGVDEFDPRFFNISPKEAKLIDPQERLFLEHAWMAMEDAGYTRAELQSPVSNDLPGQAGVYVGLMYSEYQLFGAEAGVGVGNSAASIANRVSYVLNLHGPSMTLDTMCSSSLSAIHLACQDLKQGRTSVAIAGGVNVSIHPNKYLVLSAGQFISSEGHCQSFGEGGDGYIPGEGVGVVVLKRLSDAERDGDHIYGVIRGSALNHGGKTNGYTVPNPQAQASAISRALAESGVDARQISYIEAHGTGTRLGDPIEIAALSKAFAPYTDQREFCLIGSAKSNIGHCESAAGIAGLTKVLLQMQHGEIVPSLHSEVLNPHIDFSQSPFVVNQRLRSWERPVVEGRESRRIAGISSFGAGGSNAHLIVEEYPEPASMAKPNSVLAIVISARTAAQLQEKARELLRFVSERPVDLVRLAYTLQVGREGMEERVGLVVSTVAELEQKLTGYVNGATDLEEVYAGQVRKNKEGLWLFNTDADLQQTMEKWLEAGKLTRLLELWVQGVEIDWAKLYKEARPRRMSLPAYPFARERYWIEVAARQDATTSGPSHLHPLLHRNTSDLREQRYSSTFTGEEFFLSSESKFLPMAACLEMARAAVEQAWPGEGWVELREVVWLSPIEVNGQWQVHIALQEAAEGEQVEYEIYSQQGPDEVVYCRGQAVRS